MIIAYTIILMIFLALLLQRDLTAISRLPFKGGWKVAFMVAGLLFLQFVLVIFAGQRTWLEMALVILSHLAVMFVALLNRHIPGAKLFALGIVLNTLVMAANGGWMPITPAMHQYVHPDQTLAVETKPPLSKSIILSRSETRLWVLSDIIPAPLPWRRYVISLGDILLVLGAAQFIFQTTAVKETSPPDPILQG